MAKKFADALRQKRATTATATSQSQVKTRQTERELALPHEDLSQQELKVNQLRQEEPAGQVIRVPIDDVYALAQVRPEEDFEEEVIDEMKQTYGDFGILMPPRCFPAISTAIAFGWAKHGGVLQRRKGIYSSTFMSVHRPKTRKSVSMAS
ncbi:hypothetical protein SODG_005880 [Sodalis praecaptivus]